MTAAIPRELVTQAPAKPPTSVSRTRAGRDGNPYSASRGATACIVMPARTGASGQTTLSPSKNAMFAIPASATVPSSATSRASS